MHRQTIGGDVLVDGMAHLLDRLQVFAQGEGVRGLLRPLMDHARARRAAAPARRDEGDAA